ncbi:ABC transporter substrate-binding protein [Ferrimicrobium sp.]|uniref:ABC transporter substrate-binding protein n=1 Tax=Ferrimicrobium sp. TaxID=2926050 RepID=UPI0026270989|nr:ABC transporter substrate-binding protein [Ferrimicrobium sp.]
MKNQPESPTPFSTPVNRRDFIRYSGMLGVAAAASAALGACGFTGSSQSASSTTSSQPLPAGAKPVPTGSITAGLAYNLDTNFDPMLASGAAALALNMHVFEGLVDMNMPNRQPYNTLAESVTQAGPTTWKAKIRSGATFHDGSPVTADDVVFSYTRILDPANNSALTEFLPFLKSVVATGTDTVQFNLNYPFSLFPSRITAVKIVPKAIVVADPAGFALHPVGSGPFMVTSATPEVSYVLNAYDKYNGPKPAKVETLTFLPITNAAARVTALQSNRVQAIEAVPPVDVAALKQTDTVQSVEGFDLMFMMFNCKLKPFDDVRVRQALHYALNTQQIINNGLLGYGTPATSFMPTNSSYYQRASTVYNYDPQKAKSLLAAAGVSSLNITLLSSTVNFIAACAPIIKENWDAIGVNTTLHLGGSGGLYKNLVDTGNYQVMVAPGDPSVWGPDDPDLLMRWWYVGQWPQRRYYWDGTPQAAQLVSLLNQGAQASNASTQKEIWLKAFDLLAEQVPLYPIFHANLATGWNSNLLTNFKPITTTGLDFLGVGLK